MTFQQLFQKFLAEKEAKNTAYAFILASDQLTEFKNFCESVPRGTDFHALCVAILGKEVAA